MVWPEPSWRRNKEESPLPASLQQENSGEGGTLEKAKERPPSCLHTRAEDAVPRAPAHQGPEFLQHLFFHEDKHRGDLICVPARRGNDENGKETGRDSERSWREEVDRVSERGSKERTELVKKNQGGKDEKKLEPGGMRKLEKGSPKGTRGKTLPAEIPRKDRGASTILLSYPPSVSPTNPNPFGEVQGARGWLTGWC